MQEIEHLLKEVENYLLYLQKIGVKVVPRKKSIEDFLSLEDTPSWRTLEELRRELKNCKRCKLYKERRNPVFGEGPEQASLMLVGEAPGREEDLQGKPFVGRAGKLLDQMLAAIDISRSQIFITNVVKCRPPGNRTPEVEEIEACRPFLLQQIKLIRPKIIFTLGLIAAQTILASTEPLHSLRKKIHQVGSLTVIATFHPAFLLRFPAYKREAWEDLKLLKKIIPRKG